MFLERPPKLTCAPHFCSKTAVVKPITPAPSTVMRGAGDAGAVAALAMARGLPSG
jgi:hypothetical protein